MTRSVLGGISAILRPLLVLAAILALFSLSSVNGASAASGARSYLWFAGSGPVCQLDPSACPAIARANNGDTIVLAGGGAFTIHPKSITGGGIFTHKDAAANELASGTWQATQLLGFNSYGSGAAQGLPAELEGGLLTMRVWLDPGAPGGPVLGAVLQVDCELGDHIPPGHHEGVRLNVQDVINFNEKVSGFTVYVRQ